MEKSELIQKVISITTEIIGLYQSLVIDIISFHSVKIPFEPQQEMSNNVVCGTYQNLRSACTYMQSDQDLG